MKSEIKGRRSALRDGGGFVLLIGLNVWIAWRLFRVEYTPHFSSIEGAFIGLARYSRHWGSISWWPIWHCGMPFEDTYVPLLHLTVAVVATATRMSPALAYHAVTALTYSLAPATLFLLARGFGASRGTAVVAGLAFSLFSPSAILMPEVRADLGDPFGGRRLQVLTVYGEGPHITAIAFIPVAILALENVLRRRSGRTRALAALSLAAVFLTNVPGTMGLALAVFCWICIQDRLQLPAFKAAGGAAILAYGLACFGMPPSSLKTVFVNVGPMHSGFSQTLRQPPYLLPLLLLGTAALGYGLTWCGGVPLFARFGLTYLALTTTLVLTARHHETFEILPQAGRLHLELELGASLVLAWLVWLLYRFKPTRYAVVAFGIAALVFRCQNYRRRARVDITAAKIGERSEYASARWLEENIPGQRVYASGSTAFWLNAFSDLPQFLGCCDQGRATEARSAVPYLVHAGTNPEQTRTAIMWLKAAGIQAMVVNGPESSDEYKDYNQPERFESLLPKLHRERGDTIYRIPQRTSSLAHAIHRGEAVPVAGLEFPMTQW